MRVAQVVVDVPTRSIEEPFDYLVPEDAGDVAVGSCVLVPLGGRVVVGYCVGLSSSSAHDRLRPVIAALDGVFFDARAVAVARWLAREYVAPLSESLRLFLPPGATPKAAKVTEGEDVQWTLVRPATGAVDDRWACRVAGAGYEPARSATMQRALLVALAAGPVRVAELRAELGTVDSALRALERRGAVVIEHRRRWRGDATALREAPRHAALTTGQTQALEMVEHLSANGGGVLVVDGVTGSGKTEVYLRSIERVLEAGRQACVLVPEISLTPQTVGRFRSRFSDRVAVLHSRLSAGERFDQWDLVRSGAADVVVGARSALFAPYRDLGLIVIDEEHEGSYKQSSAPRYHARDVAVRIAEEHRCPVVLGSATPSFDTLHRCDTGEWHRVELPRRVMGRALPPITVVDMAAEFAAGHRSMFSRDLTAALAGVRAVSRKAVLLLNRRGFASFLLCRECGFVPTCDACSTSLTYHEVGGRLQCHHCSAVRAVPGACPRCSSPYLRLFGTGTQRVEAELTSLFPDWEVVRMDADTTTRKGGHEQLLQRFESLETGVLLGTQMIAKGLDYADVTLVGVVAADTTLNLPDFRAAERTYQLLEQVAGRAGRGAEQGRVIIQTYWPEHPAVRAAAAHDRRVLTEPELAVRRELGYPPFGRLANVVVRSRDERAAQRAGDHLAEALAGITPGTWRILGPSPAPLARLKGVWRWHILVKAPAGADISEPLRRAIAGFSRPDGVEVAIDVDPLDLL